MSDAKVKKYLEEFSAAADKWFSDRSFIKENYDFFNIFFKKEKIERLNWEEIQEVGAHLHAANTNALAKARAFGRPNHDLGQYRKTLLLLRHGAGEISKRMHVIVDDKAYKIKGFGPAIWSELFGYAFPEQFVFKNSRSEFALNFLEYNISYDRGLDWLEKFIVYNRELDSIRDSYLAIVGKKTDLPINLELDQFFSFIHQTYSNNDAQEQDEIDELEHYFAYHKAHENGELEIEEDEETSFWSAKPEKFLEKSMGQYVWIIESDKTEEGSAVYRLCGLYTVENIRKSKEGFRLSGTVAYSFEPKINLTTFDWFQNLFVKKSLFSFGFSSLPPELRSHFIRLLSDPFGFDVEDYIIGLNSLNQGQLKFLTTLYQQKNSSASSTEMAQLMNYKDQVVANNVIGSIGTDIVIANKINPEKLFINKILQPYEVIGLWVDGKWVMNKNLIEAIKTMDAKNTNIVKLNVEENCKNIILYGPPGTGKTYSTIRRALKICGFGDIHSDIDAKIKFDELRESRQIDFVTFHQSYGYEDFVESLKPKPTEDEKNIIFEPEDGIFKEICVRAQLEQAPLHKSYEFDPKKTKIWKMSLGNTYDREESAIFEKCIQEKVIALGWGMGLDFTGCDNRQAVINKLKSVKADILPTDFDVTSVNYFKNSIKKDDIIIVSDGNEKFRAIGRVTGDYRFEKGTLFEQIRDVDWLLVLKESHTYKQIIRQKFSQMSIYALPLEKVYIENLQEILSKAGGNTDKIKKNYVLIIDEINRGNISKIFGELITLIEDDKRLGKPYAMKAQLPYSKESFGVPENVYILGTMNTADRSIALIDIALRRRFSFEEIKPNVEIIKNQIGNSGVVDGVDVANLFQVLNDRIEYLYDRDHRIGHAYFLGVNSIQDLKRVLIDKIIPLLQEYFTEDWSKICLILGCMNSEGEKLSNPKPVIEINKVDKRVLFRNEANNDENIYRYEISSHFRSALGVELADYFQEIVNV